MPKTFDDVLKEVFWTAYDEGFDATDRTYNPDAAWQRFRAQFGAGEVHE